MIKGYNKLTDQQKDIFDKTYEKHQECVEDKSKYIPISVKPITKTMLKVVFKNGDWYHYTSGLVWY